MKSRKNVVSAKDEYLSLLEGPPALPCITMRLQVLKLDGTSFTVVVSNNATVGDLKAVLEETVNELQMKALGYCDVQWDLVWGNFALSYMNQKLLVDGDTLRSIGIRDDEEVEFVRHASRRDMHKRRWLFGFKGCFLPADISVPM